MEGTHGSHLFFALCVRTSITPSCALRPLSHVTPSVPDMSTVDVPPPPAPKPKGARHRQTARPRPTVTGKTSGRRRRSKYDDLKPYIYNLARVHYPDIVLMKGVMRTLEDIAVDILGRVVDESRIITRCGNRKTATMQDVLSADRVVLPTNLLMLARRASISAVNLRRGSEASPPEEAEN